MFKKVSFTKYLGRTDVTRVQKENKLKKFRARLDWGGVEKSRVKLAENRLILGQIYSSLLPLPSLQSKRTIKVTLYYLTFQTDWLDVHCWKPFHFFSIYDSINVCNLCTWLLWSPTVYTWLILFYDLNKFYITYQK